MKVLVTGSHGLVGRALCLLLKRSGHQVVLFDSKFGVNHSSYGDILDLASLMNAAEGCHGIIHLAGVSRVIWGHQNPKKCWNTNVYGTRNVVRAALESPMSPWILFSSSREVYGQQSNFPVKESEVVLAPKNTYARSKLKAEKLVLAARNRGLYTGIVRLSSVYGDVYDHATRVVPAFARAAVSNTPLSIEGRDNICDFTHVSDVASAFVLFTNALRDGAIYPPIHLTSGVGTSLIKLAKLAIDSCPDSQSEIKYTKPRHYDVHQFIGCPQLAKSLLNWEVICPIEDGMRKMVIQYARYLETVKEV